MFSQTKLKGVAWMIWMDQPRIAVLVEKQENESYYCAHCVRYVEKNMPIWRIHTNVRSERIDNELANWTCCQTCLILDVFTSGLCDNWVFIDDRGVVYDKSRGIRGC